jgi:hypothetical protein
MPTNPMFAPSTLAQWFGAVGTIAAVLVALFKDAIIAWKRKPQLTAACTKDTPYTSRMPIVVHDGKGVVLWTGDCYYVRAQVENTGKTRAEKVQVYASKLAKQGADQKFVDMPAFIPLNAKWSNSPPGGVSAILDGISPKMAAFFDIVALCDPANPHKGKLAGTSEDVTMGDLQLEVAPLTGSNLLPPGTYRLTLRIAAANVQPIEKVFEFTHTGAWLQNDADMRRDCLGVSLK